MKIRKKTIDSGIYLVIDPSMDESVLMSKLKNALTRKIAAVQIWDNFETEHDVVTLAHKIHSLCLPQKTPVLINNHWELLLETDLDGVHFDTIPENIHTIKEKVNKDFIIGLTCENDLANVKWAADNNIDYISFCSMFPSASAANCEIVKPETVKKARQIFNKPLFLAGGIYPGNIKELNNLQYNGIAVISGVMSAEDPAKAIDEYNQKLNI